MASPPPPSPSSELTIDEVAPGVVRTVLSGHLTQQHADRFVAAAEDAIGRRGRIAVFHDWERMSGYDPAVRASLTRWALGRRDRLDGLHVLLQVRSPVLSMAIAASNLVLGGMMRVHEKRADFERELRAAQSG